MFRWSGFMESDQVNIFWHDWSALKAVEKMILQNVIRQCGSNTTHNPSGWQSINLVWRPSLPNSQYHFHFWDERRNEFFANNSSLLSWIHNLETKRRFQMTVQCLLALLFQAVPLLGGPPNLLLMAVDNLGWDDVSWHNPSIIMPNLGTLARCLLLPSYSETNKGLLGNLQNTT